MLWSLAIPAFMAILVFGIVGMVRAAIQVKKEMREYEEKVNQYIEEEIQSQEEELEKYKWIDEIIAKL